MQDQLELLNKTNEELKTKLSATDAEKTTLSKQISDLEAKVKAAVPADYEDLKKKVSSFEPTAKENEQLKHQLALKELEAKYPDVDFALVPPGPKDQMDAHAAKLQAMIGNAVKKVAPQDNDDGKGDRWKKVPPLGGVDQDLQGLKLDEGKIKEKMASAQKSNDLKGVMDACFEAQPKATAALFRQ